MKKHLKFYILFFAGIVLLSACQTKVQKAGAEYAKNVVVWQELTRYAGDELRHFNLTVSGAIQVNEDSVDRKFDVINVKLSSYDEDSAINLLSPEFTQMFACGNECQKVNSFNTLQELEQSVLTSFFEASEGDFFQFFGRLTSLNEKLNFYKATAPNELKQYLHWLTAKNESFSSLPAFIDWFEEYLTEEYFVQFVNDGYLRSERVNYQYVLLESGEVNDLPLDLSHSDLESLDEYTIREIELWSPEDVLAEEVVLMTSDIVTEDESLQDDLFNQREQLLPGAFIKKTNWQTAKNSRLRVGDIGCSFSANSFGIVKWLENGEVRLDLKGEARIVEDGVKLIPQSGHLYGTASNFFFVKRNSEEVYPAADVAVCEVDYLREGQTDSAQVD